MASAPPWRKRITSPGPEAFCAWISEPKGSAWVPVPQGRAPTVQASLSTNHTLASSRMVTVAVEALPSSSSIVYVKLSTPVKPAGGS